MRLGMRWMVVLLPVVVACSILPSTAPTGTRTIGLYNYFYYPATDTLIALDGDTIGVEFLWTDGAFNHSVTWDDTAYHLRNSEIQNVGTLDVTLVPGEYTYHCVTAEGIAANMVGKIVVKPHPTE